MLDKAAKAPVDELILILGRLHEDPGVTPFGVASVLYERVHRLAVIENRCVSARLDRDCEACGEWFTSVKCREQHVSQDPVTLEHVCLDPAMVPSLMPKAHGRWGWDAAYLEPERLGFQAA